MITYTQPEFEQDKLNDFAWTLYRSLRLQHVVNGTFETSTTNQHFVIKVTINAQVEKFGKPIPHSVMKVTTKLNLQEVLAHERVRSTWINIMNNEIIDAIVEHWEGVLCE